MFNFWNWGDTQFKAPVGKIQGHLDFTNKHVLGTHTANSIRIYEAIRLLLYPLWKVLWCRSSIFCCRWDTCVQNIKIIQNISFMQRNYMSHRRWHLIEKTTPTFVEFIPTGQKTVTQLLQTSYIVTFRWLTINLLMVCFNSPHWLAGKHISCFKLNCSICSKFELSSL